MTLQALVHLNVATLVDSFISLASAFALGSLIGFERQVRQRTAGLRTNALVAVAASAFVDMAAQIGSMAAHVSADRLLRCIEAVLECREALAINVKPKFAVDAMVATIGQALRD